jgi:hypothetical protein
MGSFRSPFKVRIPESLVPLVEAELLKNGVKDFKVSVEKKQVEKDVEEVEQPKQKVTVDMTEVLKRLEDIQILVNKVLKKETLVREIIIQRGEPGPAMFKQPEIEEEIFIPRPSEKISVVDLSVKTTKKDDISDQVESLLNLKK